MNKAREILALLQRIERLAARISEDYAVRRGSYLVASRVEELRTLAERAADMMQEPLDNGK